MRNHRPRSSASSLFAIALTALFALASSACGGKVVVDGESEPDPEQSTSTTGGNTPPPLECNEEPAIGKIVAVCVSMGGGDFCPPAATSPGLLQTLSDAMGVCAETSPTACCNKPALRQVVCDLPPSGDECCYHAHYIENVSCP